MKFTEMVNSPSRRKKRKAEYMRDSWDAVLVLLLSETQISHRHVNF